jgi:drug/metabolite transporter (DMT)-like permease
MTATTTTSPSTASPATGALLIVLAALIWSTGGLIVRELGPIDSWTIVFWRSLSAAAFLLVYGLFREGTGFFRAFVSMGLPGLLIAPCYAVASIGLVVSLHYTSVADVLILMSCAPLLAALISRVLLGERLSRMGWFAMALSMVGAGVMVSDSYAHGSLFGDLVALAMTLAQAVAIVTFRRHREVSLVPGVGLAMVLAALVALPLAGFQALGLREAGLIGVFGAGQLGLGLALFATGAPMVPAAQAAMLGVIEPVLGPLWVWLVIGESPSPAGWLGGSIVVTALLLFLAAAQGRSR